MGVLLPRQFAMVSIKVHLMHALGSMKFNYFGGHMEQYLHFLGSVVPGNTLKDFPLGRVNDFISEGVFRIA